jgi:hypothetical protein
MTATIELTDLTWVTFGGGDGEACDATCPHVRESWLHCVTHLGVLQGACAAGDWRCVTCGAPVLLLRIEPIR